MITIEYEIPSGASQNMMNLAVTLNPDFVGENDSGWVIAGDIIRDYYEWVNDFTATHPDYGKVWGNFEGYVYADSQEAYEHFLEHHRPDVWDYEDI